jgi:FkbM family methyltransferase
VNTVQNFQRRTPDTATGEDDFRYQLLKRVFQYCYQYHERSFDYLRFGRPRPRTIGRYLKDCIKRFLSMRGYGSQHFATAKAADQLTSILAVAHQYQSVFQELADDLSRKWFMDLICWRVLGSKHVKLAIDNPRYWNQYESIDRKYLTQKNTARGSIWQLNRYEIPGENGPLTLDVHPLNVLNTFLLEQYAYQKTTPPIRAQPGDTVIEAGGCYGDTALYFADRVGQGGKVFTFEFVPEHLHLLQRNLELNPRHREQVEVIDQALWDRSGLLLEFSQNGPGSSVRSANGEKNNSNTVGTTTIDHLVDSRNLAKVNFIKMDIEGAELRALQGAERTLRRHRPKLAISIYHAQDDFVTIPTYLCSLDLDYRLFIDHFTIHAEETVLFAVVCEDGTERPLWPRPRVVE